MINHKQLITVTCVMLALSNCAWQQNPTPSTLDNSIYNQDSLNLILHSVSKALNSQLIYKGTSGANYITVYALTLKNKPTAISIMGTPSNDTYFVNLLQSADVSDHLFAANTKIIHSPTSISNVSYDEINNPQAKKYLDSLGFGQKNNFLKRTTYFHKDNQTLKLVDYILPEQKTNSFDAYPDSM